MRSVVVEVGDDVDHHAVGRSLGGAAGGPGGAAREPATAGDAGPPAGRERFPAAGPGSSAHRAPPAGDRVRLPGRAASMADLQGLAAVGQGLLMARYQRLLAERGRLAGQVLLTAHDFGDRTAYLNARRTLVRLLEWGVIPVVNGPGAMPAPHETGVGGLAPSAVGRPDVGPS